jgi:23S rRNA-/tRNA-specific pseudouridylate synthase
VDATVGEVLQAMGEGAASAAVAEGRVFVGRKRARSIDERVHAGDELWLHAARARASLPEPFLLHHGGGLLAVHKPAGIPTIADTRGGENSLLAEAARAIGAPEATLHPTSRLDREVSGVVIFALDRVVAAALADARASGRYVRRYVAIAMATSNRAWTDDAGVWRWAIGRARDPRLRRAVPNPTPKDDAIAAETHFRLVRRSGDGRAMLLAIAPITGRTHQIRVHAAFAGAPLLGDGAYGGERRLVSARGAVRTLERIALHCARVRIEPGVGLPALDLRAPVPAELVELARALDFGADPGEALVQAVECEL